MSYRLNMAFSLAALTVSFVPIYFVSQALQPVVADSIRTEGGDYFAFLLLGLFVMALVGVALGTFPGRLSSTIANGTLEAVLATPTPMSQFILGQIGYEMLWSAFRAGLTIIAGLALGMHIVWSGTPLALVAVLLIIACYLALGVVAAAAVLVFRTSGPFIPAVMTGTALLGGVYYSTSVIPSWIQSVSAVVPLTYGLRAVRRLLLDGAALDAVSSDLTVLGVFALALSLLAAATFTYAMRYAKRAGTLSHY